MKVYVLRYNDYGISDVIGVYLTPELAMTTKQGPRVDTNWIPNENNPPTIWNAQSGLEFDAVELVIEAHELIEETEL